jgi:hypothetical protein
VCVRTWPCSFESCGLPPKVCLIAAAPRSTTSRGRTKINLTIEPRFSAGIQLIFVWCTIAGWSALHAIGDEDLLTREARAA